MRRASITAAVLLAMSGLLAACVSSGDQKVSSGAGATTTAAAGASSSTTPNGAPRTTAATTTTTEGRTAATPTQPPPTHGGNAAASARLAEILPTATDVGPAFEAGGEDVIDDPPDDADEPWGQDDDDEGEGQPSTIDETWAQICPGAEALRSPEDDENTDRVSREFDGDDNSRIHVLLDPTPLAIDAGRVEAFLDSTDRCKPLTGYNESLGADTTTTLEAVRDEAHGDVGIDVTVTGQTSFGMDPVDITIRTISFVRKGIGVTIVANSGIDGMTYEPLPIDEDQLAALADLMEQRVDDL